MPLPLLFQRHGLFSFENYDAGAAGSAALPGGAVVRDAVATGIQDRRELLQLLEGAYTQFFVRSAPAAPPAAAGRATAAGRS